MFIVHSITQQFQRWRKYIHALSRDCRYMLWLLTPIQWHRGQPLVFSPSLFVVLFDEQNVRAIWCMFGLLVLHGSPNHQDFIQCTMCVENTIILILHYFCRVFSSLLHFSKPFCLHSFKFNNGRRCIERIENTSCFFGG